MPDLRLLGDGFFVTINRLVAWLLDDAIKLVMHAVEQESEKLLGVLLPVTAELPGHAGNSAF